MSDQEMDGDQLTVRKFEIDDDSSSEPVKVYTNVDLNDADNFDLLVFIQKLQQHIKEGKSFEEIDEEMRRFSEEKNS